MRTCPSILPFPPRFVPSGKGHRSSGQARPAAQQGWKFPGTIVCPRCPEELQTLRVAVLARCLCCRTSWIRSLPGSCLCPRAALPVPESPAASRARQLSAPLPAALGHPSPESPSGLAPSSRPLAAPREGNIPSRLRELSTPQIAWPAWPPAGALRPRRGPADDLTAWEAPNMLLLPIKSKGLWAWNHREHGDCASRGRRSQEAALLERRKGRGS